MPQAKVLAEPFVEEPEEGEQEPEHRSFLKRPRTRWMLLAAILVLAVGGTLVWMHYAKIESTDNAQIEGDIVPIAARVGGTVKSVRVEDNQIVKAGDILVEIDPIDYQVALRRAEAELADAGASAKAARRNVPITSTNTTSQIESTQAMLSSAQRQVEAARAKLREAEANHVKAAADLARFKQLVDRDEIPRQQYDSAVAAEAAARAAVDSAQANVSSAESQVAQARSQVQAAGTAPEQVDVTRARAGSAEATVGKNQAAVEQAKLNLGYTVVRAPVTGVVSKKSVEPGQIVQPGQSLFAIVPLENMWVVANFKENQLKKMHPGQPAKIHVDAYGQDYKGHVDSIGGATAAKFSLLPPENATGNYVKVVQRLPVKIVFEKDQDPERRLRPGMSVVPTVTVK
jgi:membrane fusion protein (multidrug efflux system)